LAAKIKKFKIAKAIKLQSRVHKNYLQIKDRKKKYTWKTMMKMTSKKLIAI